MSKFLPVLSGLLCLAPAAHAALSISSGATAHMICTAKQCRSTAGDAVLNAGELAGMLAHANIVVKTGGGAQTIEVTAPLSWASRHVLTLKARLDVGIEAAVVVQGLGGVDVITNFGKTGNGDLKFFPGGKMDFWDTGARFVLNGRSHVLVNDVATIAADYAASNGGAVLALAKDYDAGPDGVYDNAAVTQTMYGTFEGLGHTISNFSAAGSNRPVGFFSRSAVADANGGANFIRDVTLSNVNIAGNKAYLGDGALVGDADGTRIVGVHSSGTVSGIANTDVGGLVGSGGDLERGAVVSRSDSSAAVFCGRRCHGGGLEGVGGSFLLCHAGGTVTVGPKSGGGGLVGLTVGGIVQSYATGDVVTTKNELADLGGLVGDFLLDSSIADSYALGAVRNAGDGSALGGLIGFAQTSSVTNAYAVGAVGGSTPARSSGPVIGGFIGIVFHVDGYSGAYWNVDTSGTAIGCGKSTPQNGCPATIGLSDAQLKSQLPAGFDPAIWGQGPAINNGYPYLLNNPPE